MSDAGSCGNRGESRGINRGGWEVVGEVAGEEAKGAGDECTGFQILRGNIRGIGYIVEHGQRSYKEGVRVSKRGGAEKYSFPRPFFCIIPAKRKK